MLVQGDIDMTGVETINGNVLVNLTYAKSSKITPGRLKSLTLREITGKLDITGPSQKSGADTTGFSFDFPSLERIGNVSVGGSLSFNADDMMPKFGSKTSSVAYFNISGARGNVVSDVETVSTEFRSTSNPNLANVYLPNLDYVKSLLLNGNGRLQSIRSNVTAAVRIEVSKNDRQSSLDLPQLRVLGAAGSETTSAKKPICANFHDLADLKLPALEKTISGPESTGDIEIAGCSFSTLELPTLQSVNGSMHLDGNKLLTGLDLPRLEYVTGRLALTGNGRLGSLRANMLKRVDLVYLTGNFSNVELFSLQHVENGFHIDGDASMDCSWFTDNIPGKILANGNYYCQGNDTRPDEPRKPTTPTEVPDTSQGLTTAAKAGVGVGVAVGTVVLVGLGAWILARKRRRQKKQSELDLEVTTGNDKPSSVETIRSELESGLVGEARRTAEMSSPIVRGELPG